MASPKVLNGCDWLFCSHSTSAAMLLLILLCTLLQLST